MNPDSVFAQVPDIADGVSESTKASTTEVQTITSRKKTNAQKCREYRERKKLQNTMVQNITAERSDECSKADQLQVKKPKTNAERRKKHYEAQKLKKQATKKIPKTVKQKNKEYYERKKKFRALNTLNHHSDAFPKEPNAREQWIDVTGRGNWMPRKTSTICSKHFTENDFIIKKTGYMYLEPGAIPREQVVLISSSSLEPEENTASNTEDLDMGSHEIKIEEQQIIDKTPLEVNDDTDPLRIIETIVTTNKSNQPAEKEMDQWKRPRFENNSETVSNVIERLENSISNLSSIIQSQLQTMARQTEDEFHIFAMSVAAQLRQLPLHVAVSTQNKIQNILSETRLPLVENNTYISCLKSEDMTE